MCQTRRNGVAIQCTLPGTGDNPSWDLLLDQDKIQIGSLAFRVHPRRTGIGYMQ